MLGLIAVGLSNEEIARQIYVSPSTVKTHAARAMMKLGARPGSARGIRLRGRPGPPRLGLGLESAGAGHGNGRPTPPATVSAFQVDVPSVAQ